MPDSADAKLVTTLTNEVDERIKFFRSRQAWHNTFAFWHDVGVTGLGATATALLGLTEISGDLRYQSTIRASVLFITASITVFVACEHFFRFKTWEQMYRIALGQLLSWKRGLAFNRSAQEVDNLAEAFEDAMKKVDPEPESSIWPSGKIRRLAIASFVIVALGFVVLINYAARTARPPAAPLPAQSQSSGATSSAR